MDKSPDAFRTISEVAAWLETPAHVLRFWESRFSEIKPVKRAGGRRYYRPEDMRLLGGIKHLLHTEGHSIKAVQDRIKETGIATVAAYSPPLNGVPSTPGAADAQTRGGETRGEIGAPLRALRKDAETDEAPPIGFFYDDSDDAAPPEDQSGTFHPALGADEAPAASPVVLPPASGDIGDPPDDAPGLVPPVGMAARLRALTAAEIADAPRARLVALRARLAGLR